MKKHDKNILNITMYIIAFINTAKNNLADNLQKILTEKP